MAQITVRKNIKQAAFPRQCYFCKTPTIYELEETNGVQITSKYMCTNHLLGLIRDIRVNTPELFFSVIDSMFSLGDSKELVDLVKRYDPSYKVLEETILKLEQELEQLKCEEPKQELEPVVEVVEQPSKVEEPTIDSIEEPKTIEEVNTEIVEQPKDAEEPQPIENITIEDSLEEKLEISEIVENNSEEEIQG